MSTHVTSLCYPARVPAPAAQLGIPYEQVRRFMHPFMLLSCCPGVPGSEPRFLSLLSSVRPAGSAACVP